jgi:hypothetical protein
MKPVQDVITWLCAWHPSIPESSFADGIRGLVPQWNACLRVYGDCY